MVMVLQKRGNIFFHNKQHNGGSIQIHNVSNDNESSLPGGMASMKLTNGLGSKTQSYNPVSTSKISKSIPNLEIGGRLENMNIHFRNKDSKKVKIKL